METILRFLANIPLICWFFPYRCRHCGAPLKKLQYEDLMPSEQKEYNELLDSSRVFAELFAGSTYKCTENCHGPYTHFVIL